MEIPIITNYPKPTLKYVTINQNTQLHKILSCIHAVLTKNQDNMVFHIDLVSNTIDNENKIINRNIINNLKVNMHNKNMWSIHNNQLSVCINKNLPFRIVVCDTNMPTSNIHTIIENILETNFLYNNIV